VPGRSGEGFVNSTCNICRRPVEIFYAQEKYPLYVRPVPAELIEQVPSLPICIAFCRSCHHILQVNPPDESLLEKVYASFYSSYHNTTRTGIGIRQAQQFLEFLLRHPQNLKNPPGKALEIGCSDGYFLSLLDELKWEVYGCDPSPLTEGLKKTYDSDKIKRTFYAQKYFPQEYFDLVVLRHLLEHLPDPVELLSQIIYNLRPEGSIAVEVPNVSHTLQHGVAGDFCHEHLSYFTVQSLSIALRTSGFQNIIIEEEGPFLYSLAQKAKTDVGVQVELFAQAMERLRNELAAFQQEWESENRRVFIYGAGGHTTGLLNRVMKEQVSGLIDGDPGKWGKYLPGFDKEVFPPGKLDELKPGDVIIVSSRVFQDEIVESLRKYVERGIKVLILYPNCQYI